MITFTSSLLVVLTSAGQLADGADTAAPAAPTVANEDDDGLEAAPDSGPAANLDKRLLDPPHEPADEKLDEKLDEKTVLRVREEIVEESCRYDWTRDVWRCDTQRLAEVPHEVMTLSPGALPLEVLPRRFAVGPDGLPKWMPEQLQDGWWVCVSSLEVVFPDERPVNVDWSAVRLVVNGDALDAVPGPARRGETRANDAARGPVREEVYPKAGECIGPPVLHSSEERVEIQLELPYEVEGQRHVARWTRVVDHRPLDEKTAMAMIDRPRLPLDGPPDKPPPPLIETFHPWATTVGLTGLGLVSGAALSTAVLMGTGSVPAATAPWLVGGLAVAGVASTVATVGGIVIDGFAGWFWLKGWAANFEYEVKLGTWRHWQRARAAYDRRRAELEHEAE